MAVRRYSRTVLSDGAMIVKSEVDTNMGLTFQFHLHTGNRPSLTVFTVAYSSLPHMLTELAHFLNRANRIVHGESISESIEDYTIF